MTPPEGLGEYAPSGGTRWPILRRDGDPCGRGADAQREGEGYRGVRSIAVVRALPADLQAFHGKGRRVAHSGSQTCDVGGAPGVTSVRSRWRRPERSGEAARRAHASRSPPCGSRPGCADRRPDYPQRMGYSLLMSWSGPPYIALGLACSGSRWSVLARSTTSGTPCSSERS